MASTYVQRMSQLHSTRHFGQLACGIAAVVALGASFSAQSPAPIDFARDVQPILRQNCYSCHGPSQQMNGLRLDRRGDAMRGGTIPVIGPGNSAGSRLYLRLTGNAYGVQMPPTGPLAADQIATIKHWIDEGAVWPDDVSGEAPAAPVDPEVTRLLGAIRRGDADAVEPIVSANGAVVTRKGAGGITPLMYATLYGSATSVRILLDAGADPNAKDDAGATALMWAVDDVEKTRLLLDRGAAVDARSDDRRTPLLIAAGIPGSSDVVRLLLDHGANPSVTAPGLLSDTTPLTEAAYAGDETVFRLLVDHGADLKTAGPVAIGLALRARCMPCVEALMPTVRPPELSVAASLAGPPFGPSLATVMLLDRGADVHATDRAGRTLLMLAAASDALPVDVVKTLIARGVDVNAKAPTGDTALGLARLHGRTAVVDALTAAGARDVPSPQEAQATPSRATSIAAAIARSVPLLQQNEVTFLKKSGCVSCHNNSIAAFAVSTVRHRGLPVDAGIERAQTARIAGYVESWRERALQGISIPGDADSVAYVLLGLAAEGHDPDAATDAMARLLKRQQAPDGHWRSFAHRPPLESSDIQVTATAMHALTVYAPSAQRDGYRQAAARAGTWLSAQTPATNEDRAFQLLGLAWSTASRDQVVKAGRALIGEQRADGGWGQTRELPSDAYATGQALVALIESGAVTPRDSAYRRGITFLLNTQDADGAWLVQSRVLPIQPYFESGFPFGRNQFISAAGTAWATAALAHAYVDPRQSRAK